jgi:hypothetical protein
MSRSRLASFAALLLAGCAPGGDDPCRPGFTRAQDGHCYPPPPDPGPPSATDVLLGRGPCVPRPPGEDIDLFGGCIEGACAGDPFDAIDLALGRGATCTRNQDDTDWTCDWPQGVQATFEVEPSDTLLPNGASTSPWIRATAGYEGSSPEGLGAALAMACFVEELGEPTIAEFVNRTGELLAEELIWDSFGIEIEDEERNSDGVRFSDGLVDEITLSGPG